jgi:hypothetical protein
VILPVRKFPTNINFYKKIMRLPILAFIIAFNPLFLCLSQASPSPEQLVVFKSGAASACGFFGKQGDKTYVFTSMHGLGSTGLNLFTKDGKQIKTGMVEIASDRDIVRFSIDETPGSFLEIEEQVSMGQPVTIFSASADPKKATFGTDSRNATVNGIGPEFFSLSKIDKSPYLLSGSPAISDKDKVIGIASCDIAVLEKPDPINTDPKKPELFIKVDWGNAVCSRFTDDMKWLTVSKADLTFQLKTLADSRNLVDDYVAVACLWYPNPYGKIELANPRVEIKPWLEEHNKKMENSLKSIATIAKDPNHYQDIVRQMQDTARSDGMRLSGFASSRATAMRNINLAPYMKYYAAEMSVFFDEISRRISARTSSLNYLAPSTFAPPPPPKK